MGAIEYCYKESVRIPKQHDIVFISWVSEAEHFTLTDEPWGVWLEDPGKMTMLWQHHVLYFPKHINNTLDPWYTIVKCLFVWFCCFFVYPLTFLYIISSVFEEVWNYSKVIYNSVPFICGPNNLILQSLPRWRGQNINYNLWSQGKPMYLSHGEP